VRLPVFKLDPLAPGAGVNILGLMLFPNLKDEPRRIQFNRYVDHHELALQGTAQTDIAGPAILETALMKQFGQYTSPDLLHGRTTGELLLTVRTLASHHPEHGELASAKPRGF
jgi:hypothetical protein